MRSMLRTIALSTVALVQAVPAFAQPSRVHDGTVSPEACAALGFSRPEVHEIMVSGRRTPPPPSRPRLQARPAVNQPAGIPQIPPLPVPPVSKHVVAPTPQAGAGLVLPTSRPPAVETERYPAATSNPIKQVAEQPVSTFSIDVDTASYSNVRRYLNDGHLPPRSAVRVEELINYFDYNYPSPTGAEMPFRPFVALTPSPWASGKQILHIGLQGYDLKSAERPPLNLVFLIDTSGSMSGEDRLPLARKSLNLMIDQLRPQDRVAMVTYAGSAGAVLAPTDGRQKLKMRCALDFLEAGGSTAGGQGLALAYALAKENFDPKAINRVVLLTDGDFNVGVADPEKLKDFVSEQRRGGTYLSVYGFGRVNYIDIILQWLANN
jgi:Ca-activated chloride channel homolog